MVHLRRVVIEGADVGEVGEAVRRCIRSGRSVIGVGFENDALLAQSGPPFIKYDVMRFKEPL